MKQLLSLSDEVRERLAGEKNKSALVDAVLARHYGIEPQGDKPHQRKRREILDSLLHKPRAEVKINVLGRPAEQTPTGEFVDLVEPAPKVPEPKVTVPAATEDMCSIHNRAKIGGVCLDCL